MKSGLTKLIPQAVHVDLPCTTTAVSVNGEPTTVEPFYIKQRDCVENMMRNICNMAYLFPNGDFRTSVEDKLFGTRVLDFYNALAPDQRVSDDINFARQWLTMTTGLESHGVIYDPLQGGREVLTGIDNILSLFEGLTSVNSPLDLQQSFENVDGPNLSTTRVICADSLRSFRIQHMCEVLSSCDMKVKCAVPKQGVLNYTDITLKYEYRWNGKKTVDKVKLLITTEHVCIRHGDLMSN